MTYRHRNSTRGRWVLTAAVLSALACQRMAPETDSLLNASRTGVLSEVRTRLDAGEDVDGISSPTFHYTPLHAAAEFGHLRVVKTLVRNGATIDTWTMPDGAAPIHLAAARGHKKVVRYLLKAGADIAFPGADGAALHYAVRNERKAMVKWLLNHGADPNQITDYLRPMGTALHVAAAYGYPEMAELLLTYGADPTRKDDRGRSPADLARDAGYTELAARLEAAP